MDTGRKKTFAAFLLFCLRFISPETNAATPETPQPPGTNLFANPNFDKFTLEENLWDGVDAAGYLAGFVDSVDAISKGGTAPTKMPPSVAFVDMNGDGLPDLVVADPVGLYKVYFNSGTRAEPKFTQCEFIPIFPSRWTAKDEEELAFMIRWETVGARRAPRICVADWARRSGLDLLIGNYVGEFLVIPNTGSASKPDYKQTEKKDGYVVNTADEGKLWGNLFAPAVYDFQNNGRLALLMGEGSYSANAVHIFANNSGFARGFKTNDRNYLLYGDGREILTPTVADYNGDGLPDVLVSDREGTVGVYQNQGDWKPGMELPLYTLIQFGKTKSLGSLVTITAADYNGDGLFDLIVGKPNGHIAVTLNKGTKEQPVFDQPVDIKGEDLWKRTVKAPVGWKVDSGGIRRGNLYVYAATVNTDEDTDAIPPAGTTALKFGYYPCPNKILRKPDLNLPAQHFQKVHSESTRCVKFTQSVSVKVGSTYTVSFKVKGKEATNGNYDIEYGTKGTPMKITQGERGSVKVSTPEEHVHEDGQFTVSDKWTQVSRTVTVQLKNQALKEKEKIGMSLSIRFELKPYDGVAYFDDMQMVEKIR